MRALCVAVFLSLTAADHDGDGHFDLLVGDTFGESGRYPVRARLLARDGTGVEVRRLVEVE